MTLNLLLSIVGLCREVEAMLRGEVDGYAVYMRPEIRDAIGVVDVIDTGHHVFPIVTYSDIPEKETIIGSFSSEVYVIHRSEFEKLKKKHG